METNTLTLPNLERVLGEYAAEFQETYKKHLVEGDRLASEKLFNSVQTQVERDGTAYLVSISLEDYWKYVENDTAPHWPPPSALLQWIAVKPVIPRPDDKGRIPTPKQLAYLIGRKIAREGTEGSHDLALTAAEVNDKYEPLLSEALALDLGENVHAWFLEAFNYYRR